WRYDWDDEEARKNILRTHTTAVSSRMLHGIAEEYKRTGVFKPAKMFSIDRVFRNETCDQTHLAEFHQVEGFVCDKDLNVGHLMGVIRAFFAAQGITDISFKPAYNPYTEPSMEIFCYHPLLKKQIEIGNSGMFRPEMLRPMGLPEGVNVIAWGLSLERPTMIKYGISDIRTLIGAGVDIKGHDFTKSRFSREMESQDPITEPAPERSEEESSIDPRAVKFLLKTTPENVDEQIEEYRVISKYDKLLKELREMEGDIELYIDDELDIIDPGRWDACSDILDRVLGLWKSSRKQFKKAMPIELGNILYQLSSFSAKIKPGSDEHKSLHKLQAKAHVQIIQKLKKLDDELINEIEMGAQRELIRSQETKEEEEEDLSTMEEEEEEEESVEDEISQSEDEDLDSNRILDFFDVQRQQVEGRVAITSNKEFDAALLQLNEGKSSKDEVVARVDTLLQTTTDPARHFKVIMVELNLLFHTAQSDARGMLRRRWRRAMIDIVRLIRLIMTHENLHDAVDAISSHSHNAESRSEEFIHRALVLLQQHLTHTLTVTPLVSSIVTV
ncbi:Phenylalanine--tRNA ligase alpha subunit, partial [Aduncisulcus paluster]